MSRPSLKQGLTLLVLLGASLLLSGCAQDPAVNQIQVEVQIVASKSQTYEVKVADDRGITRLDAMLGKDDRTSVKIERSDRYQVVADTFSSASKKNPAKRVNLCNMPTKSAVNSFVIIVADDGCHLTYAR